PGGGYQLAKDTISSFIGRRIDYYARVNFDGFREIVDLVGGVDVDVPYTIHDEQYPTSDYGVETFHLEAGLQHLDGETALKYARTRNVDGDYSRARRQQDIIRSVADKVLNANMIPQLLPRVPQLLVAMQNSIETDMPVPLGLELSKVIKLDLIKNMQHLVLDNQYGQETFSSEGAWILVPDRTRVRAALDQFYAPITQSSSALSVAAGTPGGLRIEVLNGTSQPGAASRTAQLLESQGWPVVSIGDADRSDYGQTIVINYGAPDALVERVITDLSLEPTNARLNGLHAPSPVDVRIVVGQDILPTLK
ncbi:MAG: LCP family protein, partial [Caldilineaceae bacterium]|nr:LCP family protein [Caldilineaceae bacterium]